MPPSPRAPGVDTAEENLDLTLTGRIEDVGEDGSSLRSEWKNNLKTDIAANLGISDWRLMVRTVRVKPPDQVIVNLQILDTPASAYEMSAAHCREKLRSEALSLTGANHTPAMPFVLDGLSLSMLTIKADRGADRDGGGGGAAGVVIVILLLIGLAGAGFVYYKKRYKRARPMSYVSHTDHTSAPLPSFGGVNAASSTTRPAGLAAGSIVSPAVVPVAASMEIANSGSTYTPPVATPMISADSSNA